MAAASGNPSHVEQAEPVAASLAREASAGGENIGGSGLSVDEVRTVARRQLVGSIAVACVIAMAAGLIAVRPSQHDTQSVAARSFPTVQQPIFMAPSERLAATSNRAADLP